MKLARLRRQAAEGIMHNSKAGDALACSRVDNTDQVTCVKCVHEIWRRTVHGLPLQNAGFEAVPYEVADILAARLNVNDLYVGLAIPVSPRETGRGYPLKGFALIRALIGKSADKLHGRSG